MRGTEKQEEKKQIYVYTRCSNCGIKLHYAAYRCMKCGHKPENILIHSTNPEDAKYCAEYCSTEKCMRCFNVLNGKEPCKQIYCYGSGKGKCDICKKTENTRFDCCQEDQKQRRT